MSPFQSVSFLLVYASLQTALCQEPASSEEESLNTTETTLEQADGGILWPPSYSNITVEVAPYIAGLLDSEDRTCGGSIIDKWFLLTSASCVKFGNPIERAFVGSEDVDLYGTSFHQIAKEFCHRRFDAQPLANDICLLKLSFPLTFNDRVAAVKLPGMHYIIPEGSVVNVTGWGIKPDDDRHPVYLRQAMTAILSYQDCLLASEMNAKTLCTEKPIEAFNESDVGGPLTHNDVQIGILIVGPSDDDNDNHMAIFTEVFHYSDWIRSTITRNT